jgi:hypothetical protein
MTKKWRKSIPNCIKILGLGEKQVAQAIGEMKRPPVSAVLLLV